MKALQLCVGLSMALLLLALVFGPVLAQTAPPAQTQAHLIFVENVGQFPSNARFYVYGADHAIWLADDALWVTVDEGAEKAVNLKLSFSGANPQPRMQPFGRLKTAVNYYRGQDSDNWQANVPTWAGVRYENLYPGVDLEVTSQDGHLSWQLVRRANSPFDLQNVKLRIEGADTLTLDGDLLRLDTALGDFMLPLLAVEGTIPTAISEIRPLEREAFDVSSPFAQSETTNYGPHTPSQGTSLVLGTFLGASGNHDEGKAIAVDEDGAIYVTGWTFSPDFPTTPGLDDSLGGSADAFVAKFNATGSDLVYSTYLGGTYQEAGYEDWILESGYDIAVDDGGSAYLTGHTYSPDFPATAGAFDTSFNGPEECNGPLSCPDVFVSRLDSDGQLAYSTFLGGSYLPYGVSGGGTDEGKAIALDGQGMVYVTGWTESYDFPTTPGAYKRVFSDVDWGLNDDVFVAKLNLAGNGASDLVYSTYLGGASEERGQDIAVDENGTVYVTGYYSHLMGPHFDFPTTPGAYDPGPITDSGERDAFVFKLAPNGNGASDLLYSTLLGPDVVPYVGGWDRGHGIAVDSAGSVYVVGNTDGQDFPTTPGAFDRTCGTDGTCDFIPDFGSPGDAFISKLNLDGNGTADLVYSTFLGGNYLDADDFADIAVDAEGDVYVTGDTGWNPNLGANNDFPTTPGAVDSTFNGFSDLFVTRLSPDGNGAEDLMYSTLLGGPEPDDGIGIAVGAPGDVYVVGATGSDDFPTTPGAYDTVFGGGTCGTYPDSSPVICTDVFVVELDAVPVQIISGQVLDSSNEPISDTRISAGGTYSATTNAGGWYTITVPSGTYTITPAPGYFWSPETRSVTVPPSAAGQDFVGSHIQKQVSPATYQGTLDLGDRLTYTVHLVYHEDGDLVLYDPLPPYTYTRYVSGSLKLGSGMGGTSSVDYVSATHTISGTLSLTATVPTSLSFAVQMQIAGTAGFAPIITNRACIHLPGEDVADCEWSNEVHSFTYAQSVYLPLVLRNHAP
jgi:hypothetical protein